MVGHFENRADESADGGGDDVRSGVGNHEQVGTRAANRRKAVFMGNGGGVWRYSLVRDFGVIWQMTDLWIGWDAGNVSPPSSRSYEGKRPLGWSVTRWESPSQVSRRLDG